MLGDDLGELLEGRIPADHSRRVLAEGLAARVVSAAGARGMRVLDLGCGAGDSVDLFRSLDPEVRWVGVDIELSPEVASRVRDDAEFVTFDGVNLPFDDGFFDAIYCKQVLEHVAHPRELLADVARALAPGGWFMGATSQLEPFHSRSTFNWTPYGFTRTAEEAGLEVVELRPVIDGFTLVARAALGLPRFFDRWWARESLPYRLIELAARAGRMDARTRNQIKLVLAGQFAFLARRPPR